MCVYMYVYMVVIIWELWVLRWKDDDSNIIDVMLKIDYGFVASSSFLNRKKEFNTNTKNFNIKFEK